MQAGGKRLAVKKPFQMQAKRCALIAEIGFHLIQHVVHVPTQSSDFIVAMVDARDTTIEAPLTDVSHQRIQSGKGSQTAPQ